MALAQEEITGKIIGAAFEVHRVHGDGFLEKVYQRAMPVELQGLGLTAEMEHKIKVHYKGNIVGDYAADLFVAGAVIVELKVARSYNPEDEAQLLNELKATGIKVGLLINFGRIKVEFKRFVFSSVFRPWLKKPLRVESLKDRTLLDAVRWINAAGGDWATAVCWSPHAPGPADDVTIDLPGNITITHSSGTDAIHSYFEQRRRGALPKVY